MYVQNNITNIILLWHRVVPSRGCGPFREYGHAYDVMIEAVQSWPGFIQYSFTLMTSTTSFIVLLAVLVYVASALCGRIRLRSLKTKKAFRVNH